MVQAVILAGGKGSRLAEVSGGLPKPLVPVGGVPIIERQIALLARYGIDEIFLTTGYRASVLEERLGDGQRLGVKLHHVVEATPLGTAGGVAALRGRLRGVFLVLYGDVMVHMDLARLLDFHRSTRAGATLVVHPNDHPFDSDLVELGEDDRVVAFHPAPRPTGARDLPNTVSAALYAVDDHVLDFIEPGVAQDFVKHVFPRMLDRGARLYGYRTTEYLKDMGTPDRLARVEGDYASGFVERMHRDQRRPAAFFDRDGVINVEVGGVHSPDRLELLPGAAEAIRRFNRAGWITAVITNQPDVAKGRMAEKDVDAVHRRMHTALGRAGAWVDEIRYCPHHPDGGFPGERAELKVACACRKPAPGMLDELMRALPVDPGASAVIGDSWRDMAVAHACHVDAIGVRTGHALSAPPPPDHVLDGRPDVVVDDLAAAASLLLEVDPAVEALAERIAESVSARGGSGPDLVLLGGLSCSGKTTTCFQLRRLLRARGYATRILRLDDWIVPRSERNVGTTVAERYRLGALRSAIARFARGEPIVAPGYDARTREGLGRPVPHSPRGADVVLVEGIPALLLDPQEVPGLRVYVSAPDEGERRRRVHTLYQGERLAPEAVDALLAEREEEHRAIEASATSACLRIVPGRSASLEARPDPCGVSL